MNAINFIKDHGVEKAMEVVEGAPNTATHFLYDLELGSADYLKHVPDVSRFSFDLWDSKVWKPFLRSKKRISLSELKRLVESVGLIKCFDDLEQAKSWLFDLEDDVPYVFKGDTYDNKFYKHELEQAISDYELIYEVK